MNVVAAIIWFIGAVLAVLDVRQAYLVDSPFGMAAWTVIAFGCVVIGLAHII